MIYSVFSNSHSTGHENLPGIWTPGCMKGRQLLHHPKPESFRNIERAVIAILLCVEARFLCRSLEQSWLIPKLKHANRDSQMTAEGVFEVQRAISDAHDKARIFGVNSVLAGYLPVHRGK